MPSDCVFEFDRPSPVYYSGETINGRINLNTTSEKTVRSVYIRFEGEGKVRWEESRSRTENGKTHHYTEYYRATENYLNSRTEVFGNGQLPPGTHSYTFCIPLPLECPTSCVEKYGQIRYQISLVLDRPMRFDNVFNQPLTVIKQLNLNWSPEYLLPIKAEDIKFFCCWWCSSGPVLTTLTIPFSGYAPGQAIKCTVEVDNNATGNDIEGFDLKLKQTYEFTAHTPQNKTRSHSNTLASLWRSERILRLSKRVFQEELTIPPVPPTSQNGRIICVHYNIKLELECGGCHSNAEIYVPITIGTVPLAQSASNPENVVMIPATAPEMTPDTPGSDKPPSYDICKPPSFEEATNIGEKFIDTDVDARNRDEDFIPKYPMYYNFAVPTAPPIAPINEAGETPLLASTSTSVVASQPLPYPTHGGAMPMPPTFSVNDTYGQRQ